jgi:uncharacterized membrane protein
MPTKYDTNPLDPEFPEKAKAVESATTALPFTGAETRQFADGVATEEQTRRFASPGMPGYTPPYNGQYVPANYRAAPFVRTDETGSRKVSKVGLPENVMTALPYVPWYLGLVAGLLILFFVPRSEAKVRFHAAQGLAAHLAILLVSSILGVLSQVTDFADFGNGLFNVVTMIMLIVFAYKAWKGRPVHIESIDDLTNWLEEKIAPKQ